MSNKITKRTPADTFCLIVMLLATLRFVSGLQRLFTILPGSLWNTYHSMAYNTGYLLGTEMSLFAPLCIIIICIRMVKRSNYML